MMKGKREKKGEKWEKRREKDDKGRCMSILYLRRGKYIFSPNPYATYQGGKISFRNEYEFGTTKNMILGKIYTPE